MTRIRPSASLKTSVQLAAYFSEQQP